MKLDTYAAPSWAPTPHPFSPDDAILGSIQDIAPYGLFTTDADLVIRSWNQWLATHSGLPARAVVGRPLIEVFPDVRERKLEAHFVRALQGEISVLSTALHKYLLPLPPSLRNSDIPWMLQTAWIGPLPAGETIIGTIAIIEDVTQRECQAQLLRRQHEQHAAQLEAKIAERTAKLRDTIVQLERFSSTIAHDLRAPIRSLMGFTGILLTDFATALPPDAQYMLRRLEDASHRLDALTRDLLKFSCIVREDVQLASVDVDELVHDIASGRPELQHGVLTVRPPLGMVSAQRTLLQQCLCNLFDNALKFTPPGVQPAILVRSELRGTVAPDLPRTGAPFHSPTSGTTTPAGPRRRIWIEDNGIGIPLEAQQKIFGIFERLPSSIPIEGTGIGLAIVARAIEQMGGACGVESTPGQGSRFWLELHAAQSDAGQAR